MLHFKKLRFYRHNIISNIDKEVKNAAIMYNLIDGRLFVTCVIKESEYLYNL